MAEEMPMPFEERQRRYASYLGEAEELAEKLQKQKPPKDFILEGTLGKLQFFVLPECCVRPGTTNSRNGFIGKLTSIFSSK